MNSQKLNSLASFARRPVAALAGAAICAIAAAFLLCGAIAAHDRIAAADDPVAISDRALAHAFDRKVAEREIQAALAAGDVDLAQSFVALAAERNAPIDPALPGKVEQAGADAHTMASTAGRFVHGLWTGEPTDIASLAGTAFGDLFVFGDIRDAAREGMRYLSGQAYDPWILGLAGVGIAITAVTYASLGATLPERGGLSLVKAARRTGRLNPALVARAVREAVTVEGAGGIIGLAQNTGRIEARAGSQAAFDALSVARDPQDVSRMAWLAAAKGGSTRAIVKLLGRAAIIAAVSAVELASWLLWAALALLGFCASCKTAVERATQRYLDRRRRLRESVIAISR
jgi:hypothetical protein